MNAEGCFIGTRMDTDKRGKMLFWTRMHADERRWVLYPDTDEHR